MNDMIAKLVKGETITDTDIEGALFDICDNVHSSCSGECPVYNVNGGPVHPEKPFEVNRGCDCFKNGKAMLKFLRCKNNIGKL